MDVFGNLLDKTGNTSNPYLYRGEQYDPELSAYYLRARYYQPRIGRFLTTDPIEGFVIEPITLHRYVYGNANPVNLIDPSGTICINEMLTTVEIIIQINTVSGGKPIKKRDCWADKKRFFEWLCNAIPKLAKEIEVDANVLYALAAKEGGWTDGDLDHNIPLNNPFGIQIIKNKIPVANRSYPTIGAAMENWKIQGPGIKYPDRVRGKKTTQAIIDGFQCKGELDGKCLPLNTVSAPKWEKAISTKSRWI